MTTNNLSSALWKEKEKNTEVTPLVKIAKRLEQMIQSLKDLSLHLIAIFTEREYTREEDSRLAVAATAKDKKKVGIFYTDRESTAILKKTRKKKKRAQ